MGISFSRSKKDIDKMSEVEKLKLFKALYGYYVDNNCWNNAWFKEHGIDMPINKQLSQSTESSNEIESPEDIVLTEQQKTFESSENKVNDGFTQEHFNIIKKELQQIVRDSFNALALKIEDENGSLICLLNKVEDKLMRRESEIQGFQEDSRLKSIAPLLKQFIYLGDMMRKVLYDMPVDKEMAYEYLKSQLKQLINSIDYILMDFSVDAFKHDEDNITFDPHTQQMFEYITDDITLDKKIRRTVNPGYVWTLPYIIKAKANGEPHPLKEYRMIFRREQVECYKYIGKNNNQINE